MLQSPLECEGNVFFRGCPLGQELEDRLIVGVLAASARGADDAVAAATRSAPGRALRQASKTDEAIQWFDAARMHRCLSRHAAAEAVPPRSSELLVL